MWRNVLNLFKDGNRESYGGNSEGDFRYLGGVLVFGPGDTGIVFQQHEESMGDPLDHEAILKAIRTFTPAT